MVFQKKYNKTFLIPYLRELEEKYNGKFSAEQQNTHLEKGQMIALHENIIHSVKALTESFFLLTLAMNNK